MLSLKYLIFLILFLLQNRIIFSQEDNDAIPEEELLYFECLDKFGVAVEVFEEIYNLSDEKNVRCAYDCVMNAYNVVISDEITHRYGENWLQEEYYNISSEISRNKCEENATSFKGEECMVAYQYHKCLVNEFLDIDSKYIPRKDPWKDPVVLSEHEKCLEQYSLTMVQFYGYVKGDENKNVWCAWECMLDESGMMNSENDFRDNGTSWYIHKYIDAVKEEAAEYGIDDNCKENELLRKEEKGEGCVIGEKYRKCLYGLLIKSMEITYGEDFQDITSFYYSVST